MEDLVFYIWVYFCQSYYTDKKILNMVFIFKLNLWENRFEFNLIVFKNRLNTIDDQTE